MYIFSLFCLSQVFEVGAVGSGSRCPSRYNWSISWSYWSSWYLFLHCTRNWARVAKDWWKGKWLDRLCSFFLMSLTPADMSYCCLAADLLLYYLSVQNYIMWLLLRCVRWQADMYSLGVVFFELWHPFGTAMERSIVLNDLKQKGELPSSWVAEFPEQASLLQHLMSPSPSDRPTLSLLCDDPGS